MIVTIADQYLSQNAGRRYPLADDTEGLANTSILDARITLRSAPVGFVPTATLKKMESATVGSKSVKRITVTVATAPGSTADMQFDAYTDMATDVPCTITAVSGTTVGTLTVTAAVLSEENREYGIPFAKTVVICTPLGVDSLHGSGKIYTSGSDTSDAAVAVSGEIVLVPGKNADPYIDNQHIRLDIFKGAGLGERCQEASTGQNCGNVLFSINGERPGSDGEIRIVGEDGITVTPLPDEHALLITLDSTTADKVSNTCETKC